jgi:hypothetical protein
MKIISENLLALAEGHVAKIIGYDGYKSRKLPLIWGSAAIVYEGKLHNGHYSGKYGGMETI